MRNPGLVVRHITWRGAELGIGFDDLVHCVQEVLLCSNLRKEKFKYEAKIMNSLEKNSKTCSAAAHATITIERN